jgi:FAD dependent oxidoreductase TIGR03364
MPKFRTDAPRAGRGRDRWLELRDRAGVWVHECGSVHAAHAADEAAVLREFADAAPAAGVPCEYLGAAEAARRFPAVNPDGLRGALYSPAELCIDPRAAVARLTAFLAEAHGVDVRPETAVVGVDMPRVRTAAGDTWRVDRCFVCTGSDFETLFPDVFAASGLVRCKLQMMRTGPQPGGWRLGPHLAGGLTLCHYKAFDGCPSLPALKRRVADEFPEYVRAGIHVMAAQNDAGEVLIGDSHEYGDAVTPFDKAAIDDLILSYLRRIARLPDWQVAGRWHGVYAKHPSRVVHTAEPQTGCHVISSPGGAGMTLSFGIAEEWWDGAAVPAVVGGAP